VSRFDFTWMSRLKLLLPVSCVVVVLMLHVTTTFDSGLRTQSDEAQLAFIRSEERVIFTHDEDFLIIASRSSEHPGIAYCKQGTRSIGEIIESLVLIHEVYTLKDMVGRVEYL